MASNVLVLLATYNGINYLPAQIDSILTQLDVTVTIAARDDGSTDGTREFLDAKCTKGIAFQLIPGSQRSGSAAGNFLSLITEIEIGDNEFVCLSDQDDIWLPNKIKRAIQNLKSSGSDAYSCAVTAFWPNGKEKNLEQSQRSSIADFLFEGGGQGCTFVMTNNFFRRVQNFVKANRELISGFYYHDWLIYLLAKAWGYKWFFDKRPMIRYRQHDSNVIGSRGSASAVKRRLSKIQDGWYLNQVMLASKIYIAAGGKTPTALKIIKILQRETKVNRLTKASLIFQHGRRRLSDRVVLGFAVLAGWI